MEGDHQWGRMFYELKGGDVDSVFKCVFDRWMHG